MTMACPVRDCNTRVPHQQTRFKATAEFLCPVHNIYIGASTFQYRSEQDNLLWTEPADQQSLTEARASKRESRMTRERSEDALTWNVFRHLEVSGRLGGWLRSVTGRDAIEPNVHYWSHDAASGETWKPLRDARKAFSEVDGRGSEPDMIITTKDADIWVEAKLGSSNRTRPTDVSGAQARYTGGGGNWYAHVVKSPFASVAVEQRRYELVRFWLLGSWTARRRGKRFELVNLVRNGFEENIPSFADHHFRSDASRNLHRTTWEALHGYVAASLNRNENDERLLAYMERKSLGYDSTGRLVRAFALP
jgi:hypothetical protein